MFSSLQAPIMKALQGAPALTYGGTGSAFVFYNLHISEIGVIISAFVAVCGVGLQFFVVIRNIREAKRGALELKHTTVKVASDLHEETVAVAAALKEDTATIAADLKRETN